MRKMNKAEISLVKNLLEMSSIKSMDQISLDDMLVESLSDGKMGSLRFFSSNADRKLGQCAAEVDFKDEDNVTVSVVLNLDNYGELFELDIWKVDFTKLLRWPKFEDITPVATL